MLAGEVYSMPGAVFRPRPARLIAGPVLRFAAVPLLSLAFVILLVGLLNYFKFESTYEELAERRIGIILERAELSIESAVGLGLSLADIGAAQPILDAMPRQDERIESATIFDAKDGSVVFSSRADALGNSVDPAWLAAQARAPGGRWRVMLDGSVVVGARLDSGYAEGIGGIAIVYSLADVQAEIASIRGSLAMAMATAFAIFAVLALIGLVFLTRRYRMTVAGIQKALAGEGEIDALPDDLRQAVEGFGTITAEADRELANLERAIQGNDTPAAARPGR